MSNIATEELRRLYWDKGMTIDQISDVTDLTASGVWLRMKKAGVPFRPSSQAISRTNVRTGERRCTRCQQWKADLEYEKGRAWCRPCFRAYERDYWRKKGGRRQVRNANYKLRANLRARAIHLKKKYGLSPAELEQLFAAQNGQCRICKIAGPLRGRGRLEIDHDHGTGCVRGLLCHACNMRVMHREQSNADPYAAQIDAYLHKANHAG